MSINDKTELIIENEDYVDVISALTLKYLNVYVVDPISDTAQILKLEGYVTKGILSQPKVFNYSSILSLYSKERVLCDDQENFLKHFCLENLKNYFSDKNNKQLEFSYRIIENKEVHYCSGIYNKIVRKDNYHILVAGFRNIDSIVIEQRKKIEEGLYKGYEALSSVYFSMHRLDLFSDTFHEIKSHNLIRSYQLVSSSAQENLNNIIRYTAVASFYNSMMQFVDLSTLEERMKGENCISFEFLSIQEGWCKASFIKEDETDGKLHHVLLTIEIINDEKLKEDGLRKLADTDSLTGMMNRRCGTIKMEKSIHHNKNGVFYIFDCDHFKRINDNYGHHVGDQVIVAIADCFRAICHEEDVALRLGGDEFALFSPNISTIDNAKKLFSKFISYVDQIMIPLYPQIKISMSAGACFVSDSPDVDFNFLYKKADNALYKSKKVEGSYIKFEI